MLEESTSFREEELLASSIAGLIGDARHVAVGASSPIPAAAAMLARERGGGRPYVSLLGSRRQNFFTDGGRELFDCAGQGRIDAFFLSGAQIDGEANINLVSIGDYAHPKARFPGSFGSAYLYYVVPKVILFRLEHTRRTLVEKVDFISAPGASADNVHRPGGPCALITNRCLFAFDRAPTALHARERASRAYRRRGRREHRLRLRSGRGRADDASSVARGSAHPANGGGAGAGRGLSPVRRPCVRGATNCLTHGRHLRRPWVSSPRRQGPLRRVQAGWRAGATSDSQCFTGCPLARGRHRAICSKGESE